MRTRGRPQRERIVGAHDDGDAGVRALGGKAARELFSDVENFDQSWFCIAELKDPIRLHEKAMDDYDGRFADSVIPESCVLDVLRSSVTLPERAREVVQTLFAVLVALDNGHTSSDHKMKMTLLRRKNKFCTKDPTHFRSVVCTVMLEDLQIGNVAYMEVQVCLLATATRARLGCGMVRARVVPSFVGFGSQVAVSSNARSSLYSYMHTTGPLRAFPCSRHQLTGWRALRVLPQQAGTHSRDRPG